MSLRYVIDWIRISLAKLLVIVQSAKVFLNISRISQWFRLMRCCFESASSRILCRRIEKPVAEGFAYSSDKKARTARRARASVASNAGLHL